MVKGEFDMAFAPRTKDYIFWRELGLPVGRRTLRHFEKIVSMADLRSITVESRSSELQEQMLSNAMFFSDHEYSAGR